MSSQAWLFWFNLTFIFSMNEIIETPASTKK